MFGYTCTESVEVIEGFASISDKIEIVKDEIGLSYLPIWGYSAISSLQYSEGYQIKMLEEVLDFQFCDAVIPEDGISQADVDVVQALLDTVIPEDGITQLDVDAAIQATEANYVGWCLSDTDNDGICDENEVVGCMDNTSCTYNALAEFDDESCTYATEGYDCEGNILPVLEIGALMNGGIVFYIDETGEHGLVAALADITEGSNMGNWGTPDGFEWGCYNQTVIGADGTGIGTGYQNTLDIVAHNCQTQNGGITAAQATLNYAVEGFTDWYLPSKEELQEMYNNIGNGSYQGNIGGFETSESPYYWSSSEFYNNVAWFVYFYNGTTDATYRHSSFRVRAVRAF